MTRLGAFIVDVATCLSIVLLMVRLVQFRILSTDRAALLAVGLIGLLLVARACGMSMGRFAFKVGLPVTSACVLILSSGSEAMGLFRSLLALLIVFAGLYMMIVRPRKRQKGDA